MRKDDLLNCFKNVNDDKKTIIINLIDEVVFLETQLFELKKLPMVKVHPKNNELVKPTPASKLYKEFLQQYANAIKTLSMMLRKDEEKEESPLRRYLNQLNKGMWFCLKQALKEVEEIKRLYEAMNKTKSMYLKNDYAKAIHNKKDELKFYCKCKKINIRDLFEWLEKRMDI